MPTRKCATCALRGDVRDTLSATIENQGNATSTPTLVRYYISTDNTIGSGDVEAASGSVPAVAGAVTVPVNSVITAPSTSGTYWLGACVDFFSGEVSAANNCSAAVQLGVGSIPDLVVASFSTNTPSLPSDGNARLTVYADVSNTGAGPAAATTLKFYRSNDSGIAGMGGELLDAVTVPALAAGQTTHVVRNLNPGTFPGSYWFGACTIAVSGELATANDCSIGVPVRIGAQPDLYAFFAKVTPNSVRVGGPVTFTATVTNGDQGDAAATTARILRSADSQTSRGDTLIGSVPVPIATDPFPITFPTVALSTPGTDRLGSCVDPVPFEVNPNDNFSSGAKLIVTGAPNLNLALPSLDQSDVRAGQPFTLSTTVNNSGNGDATATTVRYHSSLDATITAADPELGTDPLTALAAGASQPVTGHLVAPTQPGTYFVGACVDGVTGEITVDDNCSAGVVIGVAQCTDSDGDGFSVEGGPCGAVDCNDASTAVYPGASEACNGADDDCDGQIDEGVTLTLYRDADADGCGNAAVTTQGCGASPGSVANSTACDDTNAGVNPGRTEIPGNALDDGCNPGDQRLQGPRRRRVWQPCVRAVRAPRGRLQRLERKRESGSDRDPEQRDR